MYIGRKLNQKKSNLFKPNPSLYSPWRRDEEEGGVPNEAGDVVQLSVDNLMVQIHMVIVMIRWTGLAPWEFDLPFPCSLRSIFLEWG